MKFFLVIALLLIPPPFAGFNPFAKKKTDYTKFTAEKYGQIIDDWIKWDKGGKQTKPSDINECFSLALDSASRQKSCGKKTDPFKCLGISGNSYYRCEWGDINKAAKYTDCKPNNYARTNANCRCSKSSEKNECKWDKFCYADNTCNDKPKTAPSGCHSYKFGTTGPYKACHFPYTYLGTSYSKCINDSGSDEHWCGTSADADNGFAVCTDDCPRYEGKCVGVDAESTDDCLGFKSPDSCSVMLDSNGDEKCTWKTPENGVGLFHLINVDTNYAGPTLFLIGCFGISFYFGRQRSKHASEHYLLEEVEMQ